MATGLKLLDRHAGRGQRFGVGDALVPQGIELAVTTNAGGRP